MCDIKGDKKEAMQKEVILKDKNILVNTLNKYGSYPSKKSKGTYNCPHCKSSDGLYIKEYSNQWIYKCFSCGEGGNIFKLVEKKEGISFGSALKLICSENNIELPKMEYTKEDKTKFFINKKVEEFKNTKISNLNNNQKIAYLNKDIDRALSIEFIKDSLNINNTEYINYTKYKPNKVYCIDKYISDEMQGLKMALNKANEGYRVLLIAPTGSGKTDTTIKYIKANELYNGVFISPNASNVEQIMNKYNIPGAFGEDLNGDLALSNTNIGCLTWDKFSSLKETNLSKYVGIVDEVHQTFTDMYRKNKIRGLYDNLEKCKGQLHITATPNKLDINSYDYIIEYKQKIQTEYNVFLYNNINDSKVIEIINNSNKFALLENNTNNLNYYKECTNKQTEVLTSSLKHTSHVYDNIMRNEHIGDIQGIFNTSVIVAGVNIYDKNITDIIVVGVKDLATIKQYVARFRDLEKVNVHIFNQYEDFSDTYNIEYQINKKINEIQKALEGINFYNKQQFQECLFPFRVMKLEENNHMYYDETSNEYKIDIQGVRNEIYTRYYNKCDIVSLEDLLKEYFNNITRINILEDKSKAKKTYADMIKYDETEAKEKLKEYKNILVGANDILRNKVSSSLNNYLIENGLEEQQILEKYQEKDVKNLISIGKNKKFIDLYSKYVLENNFTYDLAWYVCTLSPGKKKSFFNSLNRMVFNRIQEDFPKFFNNKLLENRIHNLIVHDFKPGISYTKEHIENFIEGLDILLPGVKISTQKVLEVINENYKVECKNTKLGTHLLNNLYKNIVPKGVPEGKKMRIYTIKDIKTLDDLITEHGLNDLDKKVLENILDKRYSKMMSNQIVKELLEVDKIFSM